MAGLKWQQPREAPATARGAIPLRERAVSVSTPASEWPSKSRNVSSRSLVRTASLAAGRRRFGVGDLDQVMAAGQVAPAVDQVQFSPFEYRRRLLVACQRGVALEAYSPLGTGRHLAAQTVHSVAERVGCQPAQELLRWCVQHAVSVISKSTHRNGIAENAEIFDFDLSSDDMAELDALDTTGGTDQAVEDKWW
jgi:diketogulonate reductase-like aldo/keto reductase